MALAAALGAEQRRRLVDGRRSGIVPGPEAVRVKHFSVLFCMVAVVAVGQPPELLVARARLKRAQPRGAF